MKNILLGLLHHSNFDDTLKKVVRIMKAFHNVKPFIITVLGPAGVGKTFLIDPLIEAYGQLIGEGFIEGRSIIVVETPERPSSRSFPSAILDALGVFYKPTMPSDQLLDLLEQQINMQKVKLIIFDEFGHISEKQAHATKRTITDIMKNIQRKTRLRTH